MNGARRLHVAHVITTLNVGGAEQLLLDLCRRLPARGVDVSVAYLKGAGPMVPELEAAGVRVAFVPLRAPIDPTAVTRLARHLALALPDVVHTHMFKADLHGLLAARRAGIPHVVTTKHAAEESRRLGPIAAMDRRLAAESAAVVAVSEDLARFTAEVERIPRKGMRVILNGIDVSAFSSSRPAVEVREALGLAPTDEVVMTTSRLHRSKGHDLLIEAMRTVRASRRGARLVIVGDGEQRARLERMAARDGDSVIFTGTRRDIADLLVACDCFVLASRREGLGICLVEAMAAGRACVGTDAGAIPEVITDGADGVVVPRGDASSLARAIERLLGDPELRERLSAAAVETARDRFDIERTVDEYARLYREIAGL